MSINLAQDLSQSVVLLLAECVELLLVVNGDDGHSALVLDLDNLGGHGG